MLHAISNEFLTVQINDRGGALSSIIDKKTGRQLLYEIDQSLWTNQDILIFPVINLPMFRINEKTYICNMNHGIIRKMHSTVIEKKDTDLVLQFTSDENSLLQYPFTFRVLAAFTLVSDTLNITYTVINEDAVPMPFYIGGHPGLYAKGGKAVLRFPKVENPEIWVLKEGVVVEHRPYGACSFIIVCKKTLDEHKTLILSGFTTHDYVLETADVDYRLHTDAPVIGLWSTPARGEFVCFEPWWGMAMQKNDEREFSEKEFVNTITDRASFSYSIQPRVH